MRGDEGVMVGRVCVCVCDVSVVCVNEGCESVCVCVCVCVCDVSVVCVSEGCENE